jgi:hypothetical protein
MAIPKGNNKALMANGNSRDFMNVEVEVKPRARDVNNSE